MKSISLLSISCFVIFIIAITNSNKMVNGTPILSSKLQKAWKAFLENYGKVYSSNEEKEKRLGIFVENYNDITEHNLRYQNGNETYEKGINQFSDLTSKEFVEQYLTTSLPDNDLDLTDEMFSNYSLTYNDEKKLAYPNTLDLRSNGLVNDIQNQGQCGACWAFSATATLESAYKLKSNDLLKFSEQQMVDCDTDSYTYYQGNQGCNGGNTFYAFIYGLTNGLLKSSDYPYTATSQTCPSESIRTPNTYKNFNIYYTIGAPVDFTKTFLNTYGVTSVYVDGSILQSYSSGVISSGCNQINHMVNLVGYTTDSWIARNSWGTSWGENGYFRIKFNSPTWDCYARFYNFAVKYV